MKLLHFTHCEDIDGMNCAVLTRKAFTDYTLVPSKTFAITKNAEEFYNDGRIYDYDLVLVTDLCIKEPLLGIIAQDKRLKDKVVILDHHQSEIADGNNKYDFVHIIVEHDGKKESGTSLYYNYLLEKSYLQRTKFFDTLVELTRAYDVWDWQKLGLTDARKLHILFETLGLDKYMEIINKKADNEKDFFFDEEDEKVIAAFEKDLLENIMAILKNVKIVEILVENKNYKIGYVHCLYKYRNDIPEYIRKNNNPYDIDAIGMIISDRDTVSYRQIKDDVDVSKVAVYFGGKGHIAAAGNPQDNARFKKFVKDKLSKN